MLAQPCEKRDEGVGRRASVARAHPVDYRPGHFRGDRRIAIALDVEEDDPVRGDASVEGGMEAPVHGLRDWAPE